MVDGRLLAFGLTGDNISISLDIWNRNRAILALAALAQSTRLDVFRLLAKHEPEGLAAGDIAKALAVPQNTMSSHLAILSRAGLVTARRISRSIVYRADLKAFQAVVLFMLRDCCDGRPEICGPVIEDLTPCCPPKTRRKDGDV